MLIERPASVQPSWRSFPQGGASVQLIQVGRTMTVRKAACVFAVVCVAAVAAPIGAEAATTSSARSAQVVQTTSLSHIPVTGKAHNGKTFRGQFTVTRFANRNGKTVALGTLTGRLGNRTVKPKQVAIPVTVPSPLSGAARTAAACPILHLTLGPLSLNLLGLQVNLNQVVLDITAQSGPGALLGNLLCSVSNLLNTQSILGTQLQGLLNLVQTLLSNPGLSSL